ncbi:hypothetical protein BDN67DRAFT_974946 [Paxillus ammoniavirescens]|nr:hypothetical protein BDN67DRAFT_974946 [Paxillus ammoniavirescens]
MAVSDYSNDNSYSEADESAFEVHGTDEASFKNNPNRAMVSPAVLLVCLMAT